MIEIKCPQKNLDIINRKKQLFKTIEKYIDSKEFKELVLLFDGRNYDDLSLKDKIDYLSEFVKIWDYRNNKERWMIQNNSFVNQNKIIIRKLLKELNLIETRSLKSNPDYILVLGGANKANFVRPIKAKRIYDMCNIKPIVVALSCEREINDIEKERYKRYGNLIKTEADALGKGIEESFKVNIKKEKNNVIEYDNDIYLINVKNNNGKRANSFDTFKEFINNFNVKDKNILLVTNQPYTSYQLLKFMDFAFDNNLFIESIGCDGICSLPEANLLQELKSNIDAIKVLSDKYLSEVLNER